MGRQDVLWLIISLAVLAILAVFWVLKRMKLRRARAWPTLFGRMDSSAVRLHSNGAQPAGSKFVAEIKYSYSLQGQRYSGSVRRSFLIKGKADKWIGNYAHGQPLMIRYNPDKPKDSVLFEDEQDGLRSPAGTSGAERSAS
jgi:hypothetical protein